MTTATESPRLTTAQAGKIFGPVLAGLLREPGLRPEFAELAIKLNSREMTRDVLDVVHKYVYAFRDMEVCSAKVNRLEKFEDAAARMRPGRRVLTDFDPMVLVSLPIGGADTVDLYSFQLPGRSRDGVDIGKEYALRGLKADPFAHLAFAIERPWLWEHLWTVSSVWQDQKGRWCYLTTQDAGYDDWMPRVTVACSEGHYCGDYYGGFQQLYLGVRT